MDIPADRIRTFFGHCFAPGEAVIEDIDIRDIAHALSLLCRANGHFKHFFSVGQHSVNCAKEGLARGYDRGLCLALLLHDASEAYISDITRPVKLKLPEYRRIEEHLEETIENALDIRLSDARRKSLADVDNTMLREEFLALADTEIKIGTELIATPDFSERSFASVEEEFLNLFGELSQRGAE